MGTEVEHRRLPSADAAFLHMDRPTNLMVINFVMLFDEPLDEERLREVIRIRLVERYPRFHQLVVEGRRPPRRAQGDGLGPGAGGSAGDRPTPGMLGRGRPGRGGPSFTEDPHF